MFHCIAGVGAIPGCSGATKGSVLLEWRRTRVGIKNREGLRVQQFDIEVDDGAGERQNE